jgi:hypothetical protein
MKMKISIRTVLFAALVVATSILVSCAPPPVSIADRISSFVNSFNGSRTDTSSNFAPGTLGSITDATYWNVILTSTDPAPYSFTPNPPDTSNSSSVQITISGQGPGFLTWHLSFVNTGTISQDWKISDIAELPGA